MSQYSYGAKIYAPMAAGDFKWTYAVGFTGYLRTITRGTETKANAHFRTPPVLFSPQCYLLFIKIRASRFVCGSQALPWQPAQPRLPRGTQRNSLSAAAFLP